MNTEKIEFIDDMDMPRFDSILANGNVEMLGVTPQRDGTECLMNIGFGYENSFGSVFFDLNLTLDGEWWLSIDDKRAASKDQLKQLFKTKFFNDIKKYYEKTVHNFEKDPSQAKFDWIEYGTDRIEQNGTFENWKDVFEAGKKAFQSPESNIANHIMKESEIDECDGGGAVAGGDAGGAVSGDTGANSSSGVSSRTSTTDVIGTFDPEKGCLGPGNFIFPTRVGKVQSRLAGNGGGAKRKKDKKGKDKKYYPEKGMKVITSYDQLTEEDDDMIKEAIWGNDNDIRDIAPWFGEWLEDYEDGDVRFEGDHDWILKRLLFIKEYLYSHLKQSQNEAKNIDESKEVNEIKNSIIHCKTIEKAKIKKMPMKNADVKQSNAISNNTIKIIKVSSKEIKASKESGKIATLQLDDDAKNINIGDIVEISKNKHYKVISKKFIKDISEYPCIEELSNNEMRKIGEAETKAIIFLVPIGTTK